MTAFAITALLLLLLGGASASAVEVTLHWTAPPCDDEIRGYRVYAGSASGQYTQVTDVGNVTQVTLGGFEPEVRYYFNVTALGPAGESPFTTEVSISKPGPVSDQEYPLALITSPKDGATVSRNSTTPIVVDASDNVGVVRVEMAVNGQIKCTTTVAPYRCAWRVPRYRHRQYLIEALAKDAASNTTTAPPIRVRTP